MEEIWKDVVGYEGLYQVSNFGRVKSCERIDASGHHRKEKILKLVQDPISDYYKVCLCKNGVVKNETVHRIVCQAFIENSDPANKTQVGHKDETRTNNCVDNLEWVTPKENSNTPLHLKRLEEQNKGKILSLETKQKISKSRMGKYTKEENPFYGKHHTEKSKSVMSEKKKGLYKGGNHPMAKLVECDNQIYGSTLEASISLGVNRSTLKGWLNGSTKMPQKWVERGLQYVQ